MLNQQNYDDSDQHKSKKKIIENERSRLKERCGFGMNVFFHLPLKREIQSIFESWIKKYNLESLYAIRMDGIDDEVGEGPLKRIVKWQFDYLDIKYARYENCPFYDELSPLDAAILDKMSRFGPEALKMLERTGELHDSAERRMIQYHQHLRYWNYFLDRAQIDLLFLVGVPHELYDYFLFRLCQIKGIQVVLATTLPFQASQRIMPLKGSYEVFDETVAARIEEYRTAYKTADDVKLGEAAQKEYDLFCGVSKQIVSVGGSRPKLSDYLSVFKSEFKRAKSDAFVRIPRHIRAKREINSLLRYYAHLTKEPDLSVPYIYFPLHYQPEMTTSPSGGWFVHQYLAVQMLSYYAPPGVWIYVKEHPVYKRVYTSTRIKAHYDLIAGLKNVKMVPLETDTIELTKHAAAVSSITGSVGYEAMYQHKPYIMFGNQVMRYGPGTLNVRNNEDCRRAMARIFDEGVTYDDRDIKIFLKVMEEVSCKGTYIKEGFTEEALAELSVKWDAILEEYFGKKDS